MENPVDNYDNPENPIFNKKAGSYFSVRRAQPLKNTYYNAKLSVGLKETEFIRSEFFGLDKILELTRKEGCVGIRIHYAKRWEDADGRETTPTNGKLTPRLLITAVDDSGHDILKDPAGLKDGDDGNGIVAEGHNCPQHCPK